MIEKASDPPRKRKVPTKKQAAFIKAYLDPNVKTVAEAGKIAGYSCRQDAHDALQTPTVQESLKGLIAELRACGIDHKRYAKKADHGLEATRGKDNAPDFKERREMLALCFKVERLLTDKDDDKSQREPIQVLIVNYGKPDSNSGNGVSAITVSSNGSKGLVKIQDDYLAPESKKNNPLSQ